MKNCKNQGVVVDGLTCVCGGTKVVSNVVEVNGKDKAYQLACPMCGIMMRAPFVRESNEEWLKKHWRDVHMKGLRRVANAEWKDGKCTGCGGESLCNGVEEEVKSMFCPHCGGRMFNGEG